MDANQKIDFLMSEVRTLQARVDKLENRQAHAFGVNPASVTHAAVSPGKMVMRDGKATLEKAS